ncbi:Molybdopterin synthase sulfur carrier subunit [compost metagenome]|jgi:molybdopterin synthase sulfur carrier subunit|uniref:molybdopterin converting factor subunit 1 n=1 Tax=Pseudomonas TaxID=286 RepID=UPI000BB38DF4|nr:MULTISPECIES: molybdopterin converting factor subunit 1 [unclassified Pseudomonas]MDF9897043.1 molybdopterin synthase sulfur carrier subunit [Pseudomonas reinekei]MDP9657834.1 molybdopterin synthase sulfur carrier subunit [Pseudomonas putida]PNB72411.1 molybdopterin converting factor subunit 1 [Pseudomonas sp. GW456-E7]MBV7576330.1 molybdopterin converting factor subunit 1 [Pseudomonas sp. PDM32]PBJ02436.1 Molybdopterin synthase sulfur carrier subunit [Pseudomonas sp. ACN5]
MILINYFARYREQLNLGGEKLPLTDSLRTIEDVRRLLMARGELWRQVLGENNLMCALNQELCHPDRVIEDFDEIAFFPPVTGG